MVWHGILGILAMTILDQTLPEQFGQHSVFSGYEDFGSKVTGRILGSVLRLTDMTILDQKLLHFTKFDCISSMLDDTPAKYERVCP